MRCAPLRTLIRLLLILGCLHVHLLLHLLLRGHHPLLLHLLLLLVHLVLLLLLALHLHLHLHLLCLLLGALLGLHLRLCLCLCLCLGRLLLRHSLLAGLLMQQHVNSTHTIIA